uniref:Ketoreductase (KR) domain-containing protein n=1 Tax=Chromera velia CCMP2878 TaxID=1169474 RepID=A0A0G4HI54_9ALVE|eukprot:Cvel_27711.t1-p1 / transcript=Cvel_27711.t1 / gene=Cvel_27711 / organism=Chromera_velia_CCMP2878 / gene_product=Tropinone reductase homolog, putative / transcript_product=Tropinone reductase homolog, putative / location=Cvel_scaffold3501:8348-10794(-) / protein_length=232 / sequence_SO=supercontig / SO=protein_coding / is_pseudo=false
MSVLIFGSKGLGAALARRLAGQRVHVASRSQDALETLAKDTGCSFSVCDVTKEGEVKRVVEEVGDVKGLVYAVGNIVVKPPSRVTRKDLMDCFLLNTVPAIEAVVAAQTSLKQNKGSVVLFSTVASRVGLPSHTVIASAKGAVEAATRSLACDLAPDVRVNCIAPSLVESPLGKTVAANPKIAEAIAGTHPLKRLGTSDDLASLTEFLLKDDSSWITGQILSVDGGKSCLLK